MFLSTQETQADTASDGELTILRAAASAGAGTPNSPKKRPPPTQDISRKRQKLDQDSEVDLPSSGRLGKPGVSIDKKKSKKALGEVQQSIDDDHQSLDDVALPEGDQESSGIAQEETLQSDMSEVLDDEPKKKPKKRRSEASTSQTKNIDRSKEKKEKKPKDENLDPDAEEIKRLQGWLVKCGMRKMWYKELQPYDGQKAKIRHLKDMLAEVGMVGRYSMEKATQIRDARELKSELEAVQEGAKQWGKADSDAEGKARPRRRVAKGLQHLDFLNDDDGEETD